MRYVDGFVLPVPKKNLQAYRRMAQKAGKVWREHGALEYRECVGDDIDVKMGGFVPENDQAQAWRDGGVRVDRVHVSSASRWRERKGHERPAPGNDDGSEGDDLRLQAHGLRRIQGPGGSLSVRCAPAEHDRLI